MLKMKPPVPSAFDPGQGRLQPLFSRGNLVIGLSVLMLAVLLLGVFAMLRVPRSLQINGYAGHLGEWELTAALSNGASVWMRELSGPLIMKHIGMCSQDGPEEKKGEMRLRLPLLSSRIEASLWIEGVECTYGGMMSDLHTGMMVCPDRSGVPLTLWTR
jgi:hypothetical protein